MEISRSKVKTTPSLRMWIKETVISGPLPKPSLLRQRYNRTYSSGSENSVISGISIYLNNRKQRHPSKYSNVNILVCLTDSFFMTAIK